MINRNLKTRIATALTLLIALTLAASWVAFRTTMKDHLVAQAASQLDQQTHLTAELLRAEGRQAFVAQMADLSASIGARITLVDASGRVVADSMAAAEKLDNHAMRPEIQLAVRTGQGTELRYSRTEKSYYLYCARSVSLPDGQAGVLRLAMPVISLNRGLQEADVRFLVLVGVTALAVIGLMLWTLRRFFRPLKELAEVADHVTADRLPIFPLMDDPDLRRLSQAMSAMSARLTAVNLEVDARRGELETLIETLPVGVLVVRSDHVARCNGQAAAMLGRGELLGRAAASELPIELLELLDRLEEGQVRPSVDLILPERQAYFVCQGRNTPRGALIVLLDQSENWRLDTARRTFIADAGHEFQTPLTAIGMTAEFLMEDATEEQKPHLQRVLDQQKRLTQLVDNLLYLSRLESEPDRPAMAPTNLSELCRQAVDERRSLPVCDALELTADVSDDAMVMGTSEELLTALDNLLDNAVKFTRARFGAERGGRVALRLFREGGGWTVQVSDNGVGILSGDAELLFHRFSRGDRAREREGVGGYGLGLAIVKRVVLRHGGRVFVVPSNEGACLAMWLPAIPGDGDILPA